jgi:hypothetical protein
MPSPNSESYAPRRRGRRSASLGAGGSLRCWASLANRSAFSRAVFFRVATASASYSIIAFRPSRARSSCLNRFSACCRACSEFTMNVSCASNVPQTPHCDVRRFNIQDICTYRGEKRPAHLIEVRCRICCTSGLLGKDRSHGQCRGGHQRVVRWPACLSFPSRRDQSRCFRVFLLIDKSARKLVHHLSENQCHVFADFQRPRFLAARGSADRQKYSADLSKPPPATRLGGRGLPRKANG